MLADLPPSPPAAYVVAALPTAGCDGLVISRIEIRSYPPSSRTAAERVAIASEVRFRGERTEPFVIRAYVRLRAGDLCTDQALLETERLLRAQRFVASVAVRALADAAGGVYVRIDVVDEVPWVADANLVGGQLSGVKFGTRSYRGRGLTLIGSTDWDGPFRPGARLHVGQYGAFGRPGFADIELDRRHLGGLLRVGFREPFLTDGQTLAMRAGLEREVEYGRLVRAGEDDAASRVERSGYNLTVLGRVGADRRAGLVGLGGLMLMGVDVNASEEVVVIADSGMFPTPDPVLTGRYPRHTEARVAAIVAARAITFRTVRRYNALRAEEDIGVGAQLELLYGPSIGGTGERDALTATDLYVGVGGPRSFASLRMRAEGRRLWDADSWRGIVAASQLTWHRLTSESRTQTITVAGARIDRLVFPAQFTLRDPNGGLIGFADSREAGGRRLMVRLEERWLLARPRTRAALAVGAFADAGKLWAGDVPYGADSPIRASAGLSLFGAYPASGKRTYRVDVGVPLNAPSGAARYAIRITSADRTGSYFREPRDVWRARATAATLVRW